MIGIYKLTSPSGKVYIGQSNDIEKRWMHYYYKDCKGQSLLYKSLYKYGYEQHLKEVLYTFPSDISQTVLDEYEMFYINQFIAGGVSMLNLKEGGKGGKLNANSIDKIKTARSMQPPPTLGLKHSDATKQKISNAHLGKYVSPETLEKMRLSQEGKQASEATKNKLSKIRTHNNHMLGKHHSDASKSLQSAAKIGNKINNKLVLNLHTGIFYDSLTDAALSIGVTMKHLSHRIHNYPKLTPFKYV